MKSVSAPTIDQIVVSNIHICPELRYWCIFNIPIVLFCRVARTCYLTFFFSCLLCLNWSPVTTIVPFVKTVLPIKNKSVYQEFLEEQ